MKVTAHHKLFAMVLSLGLIAGCSSIGDTTEDDAYGADSDVSAVDQDGGSTVYGGDDEGGVSSSEMTEEQRREAEARAEQAEREAMRDITTFYFDFDTAEIKPEARDVLVAHARYLQANPDQDVRIEGHADERGTKEYNLALGERRANAIERFLIVNGASRGQTETVSYGEEKPAVMGSDESAWAQNRRVELVFQ
ncbi:peptidoglycan-associated lipoprotein Pal [Marinobacter orientalis]|uniref:Peptidoglycan-associated lipoprotein n=1 Tax=Marinobacter orientalis TaxID=1928859 RepID=A0A7Y0RCS3_9GAMM|nr:peptidoglycan-associated lipoprotein Pal [Marinobacter orientalis]NMT63854.1 peptidoglycan-associated lipoprotein Pal [Marinobacter orientalis]TGX49956.1 peptidoglycan-associated lipoprotein Pal [Marinobacter orientalis]